MIDELIKYRYEFKRLNLDAEYIREMIFKEFNGKDGFGRLTKEHVKIWLDTLRESLDAFEYFYSNLMQIVQSA